MLIDHELNFSDCTILTSLFNEKKFPYARVIRTNGRISRIVEEKMHQKLNLNQLNFLVRIIYLELIYN